MGLTDNLISYYKLDENAANTTVADSHSSNTGTATSNTSTLTATGKINGGFDFNGTDSVSIGSGVMEFQPTDSFSLSFWTSFTTTSNQAIMGNIGNLSHNTDGWTVMVAGGNVYLQINNGTSYQNNELQISTSSPINNGSLRHVVVTYDGSESASGVTIYVDGSSVTLDTANSDNLSGSMSYANSPRIGGVGAALNEFDGIVDELGIWSRELTSSEVTELYNSGSGLAYPLNTEISISPSALTLSTTELEPSFFLDIPLTNVLGLNLSIPAPTITGTSTNTRPPHDYNSFRASGTIGSGAIRNDVYYVNGVATHGDPYDNYNDTG